MHELKTVIAQHQPDLIFITEVKAKYSQTTVTLAELQIQGYQTPITNIDIDGTRGICIYAKDGIEAQEYEFSNQPFSEAIWIQLRLKGTDTLIAGCIYRSPSSEAQNNKDLGTVLKAVAEAKMSHKLIVGDFNFSSINWEQQSTKEGSDNPNSAFINDVQDTFLFQHRVKPTRFRQGQKPSTLDLVLTNEEDMYREEEDLPPLGLSDHICQLFTFKCTSTLKGNSKSKPIYDKGHYENMKKELRTVAWEDEMAPLGVDEAWTLFNKVMLNAVKNHIPVTNPRKNKGRSIWMNRTALKKVKKKYHAWKRYLATKDGEDYVRYTKERDELRQMTRKLSHDFEKDLADNIKKNPKAFWRYVNSKTKVRCGVDDLTREDGSIASSDEDKANELNKFFASVFTVEDMGNMPNVEAYFQGDTPLSEIIITASNVCKKLKNLKGDKSAGPDGLHPRVLKETAEEISIPLAIIFNKSMEIGKLPKQWKDGTVIPLFKKGSKKKPGNYRPISLTSVVGKVMESIIRDNIIEHMMKHNLFTDDQHGFVPGRSCVTQLLEVLNRWTEWLDAGRSVDAVYLDFSKAFDSVPHERLLMKAQAYGITGKILTWLRDFLSNRRQKVQVNDKTSDWAPVTSGIPQGSVLGPTLFVIFINDLPLAAPDHIKIFADDTKLYHQVDTETDRQIMQSDLDNLNKWSHTWQLNFNADKCKVMHLGSKNKKYQYTMKSKQHDHLGQNIITDLAATSVEKDLGVHVDTSLKFHKHTAISVTKANRILGVIKRSFTNHDATTVTRLYTTLVRPHLEYANVAWGPTYKGDTDRIESVQRRATRLIPEIQGLDYEDRLRYLKLPSMKYRRQRGDMIQTYKIMKGIDRLDPESLFTRSTYMATRGHTDKLQVQHSNTELRRRFFCNRVVTDWNSLPLTAINAESVNAFKAALDKHWASQKYISELSDSSRTAHLTKTKLDRGTTGDA